MVLQFPVVFVCAVLQRQADDEDWKKSVRGLVRPWTRNAQVLQNREGRLQGYIKFT